MADIEQPLPSGFAAPPEAAAKSRSKSAARIAPASLLSGADWSESGRQAELKLYCHRLRVGLAVGLVFWLLFGFYDWVVVTWIQPGPLSALTWPRLAGALCIGMVLRCLAKDPKDRPSSARELARSLDDLGYLPASNEDHRCLSLLHDSTEVPADPG